MRTLRSWICAYTRSTRSSNRNNVRSKLWKSSLRSTDKSSSYTRSSWRDRGASEASEKKRRGTKKERQRYEGEKKEKKGKFHGWSATGPVFQNLQKPRSQPVAGLRCDLTRSSRYLLTALISFINRDGAKSVFLVVNIAWRPREKRS